MSKDSKNRNKKAIVLFFDEINTLITRPNSDAKGKLGMGATRSKFYIEMMQIQHDNATKTNRLPIIVVGSYKVKLTDSNKIKLTDSECDDLITAMWIFRKKK